MPPSVTAVIEFIEELAKNDYLKVNFKEAVRSTITVGGSTLLCTILMGPAGIPIGAVAGAGIAYARSKKFKPLFQVISELQPEEKEILAQKVMDIMDGFNAVDLVVFATLLSKNSAVKEQVILAVGECLQNELAYAITDR